MDFIVTKNSMNKLQIALLFLLLEVVLMLVFEE